MIAVIVILIALLLPAIGMARAKSRQAQCASNQGQIFVAWTQANSRERRRPVRGSQWDTRINGYVSDQVAVLFCPDDTSRSQPSSYGFNAHAWRFGADDTGRIVLLDYRQMEALVVGRTVAQLETDWPAQQAPRHFLRENVLFGDGHGGSHEPAKIDPHFCDYFVRYWRPQADANVQLGGCVNSGDPVAATPTAGATTSGSTGGETSTTGSTTAATSSSSTTTSAATTSTTTTGGTTTTSTSTGGSTTGSQQPSCDKCVDGPTNIAGLIVRYTFNDPGAIGNDTSGNNFHSPLIHLINHDPGMRCGAVSQVATGGNLGMPAAVMNTVNTSQQITVSFWFRLDYVQGYINGLVYGTNAGGSRSFNWHLPASYFSKTTELEVMWDCASGANSYDRLEEPSNIGCPRTPPPSGPKICGTGLCSGDWPGACGGGSYGSTWHHWAATKNALTGVMQVYRDGVLYNSNAIAGSGPYTNPMDTVTSLSVFNGNYRTVGWLDDFQMYNRELTAQEIQCLATP